MLEQITNVTQYLKTYGAELAEKIKREAKPLFTPGDPWDNKIAQLLRKPYQAQGDVIMGIAKALAEKNSIIVCGEMAICTQNLSPVIRPFEDSILAPPRLRSKVHPRLGPGWESMK